MVVAIDLLSDHAPPGEIERLWTTSGLSQAYISTIKRRSDSFSINRAKTEDSGAGGQPPR